MVLPRPTATRRPGSALTEGAAYDPPVPDLRPAVNTIIYRCLEVRPGENVLVVADQHGRTIGEALRDEAAAAGADAVMAVMDERAEDGTEPPQVIAAAFTACDVFIAPTRRSLSHTRARKAATDAGARGATMPGVTEEMLARVMGVDFEVMAQRSQAVAELLSSSQTAHVSCPRGTELT